MNRCVICRKFIGKKGTIFWSAHPEKQLCTNCAERLNFILKTQGISGLYDYLARR